MRSTDCKAKRKVPRRTIEIQRPGNSFSRSTVIRRHPHRPAKSCRAACARTSRNVDCRRRKTATLAAARAPVQHSKCSPAPRCLGEAPGARQAKRLLTGNQSGKASAPAFGWRRRPKGFGMQREKGLGLRRPRVARKGEASLACAPTRSRQTALTSELLALESPTLGAVALPTRTAVQYCL